MNRFECIISALIIGVIALTLILRAVGVAVKYVVNTCADAANRVVGFFGLAPDLFWALVIMIFVMAVLIWVALRMYYSVMKMRNEPSIVEVRSKRAIICRDDELTAVSFEGNPITTRRIGPTYRRLTDAEVRILRRKEEELRRVERTQSREIEYRSDLSSSGFYNDPIPGCHH